MVSTNYCPEKNADKRVFSEDPFLILTLFSQKKDAGSCVLNGRLNKNKKHRRQINPEVRKQILNMRYNESPLM